MAISIKDQKTLWGRAAGRCSMPDCRTVLVEDETETDDPALVGENCHIVGESQDGPRGVDPMVLEDRNKYANLILCCRNHHRIIDQQPGHYTVEELHRIKREHEAWVREALEAPDPAIQRDIGQYADIIDEIAKRSDFENWMAWSSSMLSHGQPRMTLVRDEALFDLRRWLARRPELPGRYPELETALLTFKWVLDDLQETFRAHTVPFGNDWLTTDKFYQRARRDDDHRRLVAEYESHVDLVEDLMCELTRAANLLIRRTRELIAPNYMRHEGDLIIQSGPNQNFAWDELVVRYTPENLAQNPIYPGLERFKEVRASRDYFFGRPDA